jgi:hypothetical protein
MSVKFKLKITYCSNDEADYPDYLIYELNRDMLNKMKKIAQFISENQLRYSIGNNFYIDKLPVYYEEDVESDIIICSVNICMASSYFYIKSTIKYTDIYIESDTLAYDYVEELLNIEELPLEHMPKYINDKDENIQNIARERLEKGEQNV